MSLSMKRFHLNALLASLAAFALVGCVATVPVKVASKGAKLGVKTAKTGVKATAAAGSLVIPDREEKSEAQD